jgi:single-stranded DNA-binding protein
MIDALVCGRLYAKPEERTSSSGKTFVSFKLLAADSDGENQFCNVVVFADTVRHAVLALDAGDSCSISGPLKFTTYTARDGAVKVSLSVVANAVLSAYHVKRKREAVAHASGPKPEPRDRARPAAKHRGLEDLAMLYGDGTGDIGDIDDDLADLLS